MNPTATLVTLFSRWSPRMILETIRRQLRRSVPFARLLGIDVESLDQQRAVTRMAAHGQLANHVGSVHAGAMFTVCEAASGAVLAGAMVEVIMHARFVVRDARIEYLKPAQGDVTARATLADEGAAVLEALRREGCAEVAVDVSAVTRGADGLEVLVARASFNWHLRLQNG
jgi:thioesterase domain-containing protein